MKQLALLALLIISIQNLDCQNLNSYRRKLSRRLTFFDIELLRATAERKRGNVMVSPASLKSALALILAGAKGDTAREIEEALRLNKDDDVTEQLNWYLAALRPNTTTAVLQSATGVFASKELKLKPQYESIARLKYLSEVTPVDFNDPTAAAAVINNWISQHTNGLIPFVVEPVHVTPPNDLILASALFFKSTWLYSFNPRETKSSCFFRDGDCKMVAMMDLKAELNYAHVEDLNAHAVELPYEGKRYSMVLLVPQFRDGIGALIRDLPYVGFSTTMNLMRPADVMLSMPRFTVNYNEDLVDALRKTHITTLFTNKSNLSNIFEDRSSHVNSLYHKVFMSVDEAGTVAAASSAASIVPLMFDGSIQVRADRPFVFFIRDNELDLVLFEGKIEEPMALESGSVNGPIIGQGPMKIPIVEYRPKVQTSLGSNTKQRTKPSSFVENLKNFFG